MQADTIIKRIFICVCWAVLAWTACFALDMQDSRTISIPRSEAADILEEWFSSSGFEVSKSTEESGLVRMNAVKEHEKWHIGLKQKSPLATQVQAAYLVNDVPELKHVQTVWNFLSGYYSGSPVDIDASSYAIPTPVLSRIESVACLSAEVGGNTVQFSGFIVDESGIILSTAHNLKGVVKITVTLFDGSKLNGEILKIDYERDLTLIDIAMNFHTSIPLAGKKNLLGMGQRIYSVGCPENLGGTVYSGFINGPPRSVNNHPLWQVHMKVYPGSSGSPVFNENGDVVAVVKGRHRGTDSLGFLIPYETIIAFVRDLGHNK